MNYPTHFTRPTDSLNEGGVSESALRRTRTYVAVASSSHRSKDGSSTPRDWIAGAGCPHPALFFQCFSHRSCQHYRPIHPRHTRAELDRLALCSLSHHSASASDWYWSERPCGTRTEHRLPTPSTNRLSIRYRPQTARFETGCCWSSASGPFTGGVPAGKRRPLRPLGRLRRYSPRQPRRSASWPHRRPARRRSRCPGSTRESPRDVRSPLRDCARRSR